MRSALQPRVWHDGPVTLGTGEHRFGGRVVNLSLGGLFIEPSAPVPLRGQLDVELPLPDGLAPIRARGEVVWTRRGAGPEEPAGVALRFVALDEAGARRIARLVASRTRAPSGLLRRKVRVRLPGLGTPLRALARDVDEQTVTLEAELPWLRLGGDIVAELGPSDVRPGKVRWVGVDVSTSGATCLRISVDVSSGGASNSVTESKFFRNPPRVDADDPTEPDGPERAFAPRHRRWSLVACLLLGGALGGGIIRFGGPYLVHRVFGLLHDSATATVISKEAEVVTPPPAAASEPPEQVIPTQTHGP